MPPATSPGGEPGDTKRLLLAWFFALVEPASLCPHELAGALLDWVVAPSISGDRLERTNKVRSTLRPCRWGRVWEGPPQQTARYLRPLCFVNATNPAAFFRSVH